ncbi:MAG TPA: OB-fold domain-containing protein, partial [Acidimicrobiia bacterium]|nr:OB-fold domain-containing protein [Acidimicrobiia bacterium]
FDAEWESISGRGTVAGWIVNHHAFSDEFASPYAVILVRLAEQDDCKLIGSFAGAIESLRPGLEVRAAFEDVAAGATLLTWEPASAE